MLDFSSRWSRHILSSNLVCVWSFHSFKWLKQYDLTMESQKTWNKQRATITNAPATRTLPFNSCGGQCIVVQVLISPTYLEKIKLILLLSHMTGNMQFRQATQIFQNVIRNCDEPDQPLSSLVSSYAIYNLVSKPHQLYWEKAVLCCMWTMNEDGEGYKSIC